MLQAEAGAPDQAMEDREAAAASRLEVMVEAALAGHDIGPFAPVDTEAGGCEAV